VSTPDDKRCAVAYATRERQYLWSVVLPYEATIADAVAAARRIANLESVPWDSAPVGIYGELRARSDVPQDGDRIELYRPLEGDPRERRRERVQRQRTAQRQRSAARTR
jgi:putative ubiquitin-RnfH superfamily antitoxin RatB of RatAB toxin-antitoxin module